jgi:hypothetical protein
VSDYIYNPRPGEELRVGPSSAGADGLASAVIGVNGGVFRSSGEVRVLAADVPTVAHRLAEAMHEAAGLPAPLILEWPAGLQDAVTIGGVTLGREGRDILVGMPRGQSTGHLSPADARDLAAVLAVYAAEAETIPDPAVVDELATVIAPAIPVAYMSVNPDAPAVIARAVLRWIKQRGADHG